MAIEIDDIQQAFDNVQEGLEDLRDGSTDAAEAAREAAKRQKEFAATVKQTASNLAQGNDNIETMTNLIGGVVSNFGRFGAVLGKTIQLMGEQAQMGMNAFYKVSAAGITTSEGISELASVLDDVDLPIDKWADQLARSSTDLAYLSGSAMQGGKEFTTTMVEMRKGLDDQLLNLGIRAEEIGDFIVEQQKLEQRLGFQRMLDSQSQAKAVVEYVKELNLLSKLTGQSTKALAEQRSALLDEARYRAWSVRRNREGAAGQRAASNMDQAMLLAGATRGGEVVQELIRGMISGVITGDTAKKMAPMGGTQMQAAMEALQRNQMTPVEFINEVKDIFQEFPDFAMKLQELGVTEGTLGPEDFVKLMDFAESAKISSKNVADAVREIKEQTGTGGEEERDDVTSDLIAAVRAMNSATGDMQKVLIANGTLAEGARLAAEGIAKVTGWVKEGIEGIQEFMGEGSMFDIAVNAFDTAVESFSRAVDTIVELVKSIPNWWDGIWDDQIESTRSGNTVKDITAARDNVRRLQNDLSGADTEAEKERIRKQIDFQTNELARATQEFEDKATRRKIAEYERQMKMVEDRMAEYRRTGLDKMNPAFFATQQAEFDRLAALVGPNTPGPEKTNIDAMAMAMQEAAPALAKATVAASKEASKTETDTRVNNDQAMLEAQKNATAAAFKMADKMEDLIAAVHNQKRSVDKLVEGQAAGNSIAKKANMIASSTR